MHAAKGGTRFTQTGIANAKQRNIRASFSLKFHLSVKSLQNCKRFLKQPGVI